MVSSSLAILYPSNSTVYKHTPLIIPLELFIEQLVPNNGQLEGGTVITIIGTGLFDSKDKQCKMILPNGGSYKVILSVQLDYF